MKKDTATKKTPKKKYKINKKRIAIILIIVILIIFIIIKNSGNKITNPKTVSLYIDNQNYTERLENDIILQEDLVYLSYEDVKKCIDEKIYIEDNKTIITSSDKKVAAIEINNGEIEINGSSILIEGTAFKTEEGTIYLPISELKNVYDIELKYFKDTKNIIIDYYSKEMKKANTTKNVTIKEEKSIFSKAVEKVKKEEDVVVISEEDGWTKVRTNLGNYGYIKNKNLTNYQTERENMQTESEEKNSKYLKKELTKKQIKKYKNRKEIIDKMLNEVVSKEYRAIKVKYKNDKKDKEWERFKIESKPMLKECGITIIFE